jgi:putative PIN family toxin of toxin-antitoxin system
VRIVCDTNVLVAALVAEGLCRDIVKRRLSAHDLFTSKGLLDELVKTLRRKFQVEARDVPFLKAYRERAELVKPEKLKRPVCRDPDDDLVLATAVAAKAHCILTGDNDLLVLGRFESIAILSPRAFVDAMDRA